MFFLVQLRFFFSDLRNIQLRGMNFLDVNLKALLLDFYFIIPFNSIHIVKSGYKLYICKYIH